jgi:predicted nuclease of predicted toxin-antitoxin system
MKLLIDMNLSPKWVEFLEGSGFEALHWCDAGPVNASDSTIMEFAREARFVILTHDLDIGASWPRREGTRPAWSRFVRMT